MTDRPRPRLEAAGTPPPWPPRPSKDTDRHTTAAVLNPVTGGKARTVLRAVTLLATSILLAATDLPTGVAAIVLATLTGLELALGVLTHGVPSE